VIHVNLQLHRQTLGYSFCTVAPTQLTSIEHLRQPDPSTRVPHLIRYPFNKAPFLPKDVDLCVRHQLACERENLLGHCLLSSNWNSIHSARPVCLQRAQLGCYERILSTDGCSPKTLPSPFSPSWWNIAFVNSKATLSGRTSNSIDSPSIPSTGSLMQCCKSNSLDILPSPPEYYRIWPRT